MGRPNNPNVFATTPLGINFQWLLDGYSSTWARDGSAEVLQALVSWEDAEAFLEEAVGYTTWQPGSPTLRRVCPLACPMREEMWCDRCELDDFGAYETRTDFFNSFGTPTQDWTIYRLNFIKPLYSVVTDFSLAALHGNKENHRFTKFSWMPQPREKVTAGYGFEFDTSPGGTGAGPWKTIAEEKTFIPDHTITYRACWLDVPVGAIPLKTILDFQTTVNSEPFQIIPGGRTWPPGELMFKGLSREMSLYADASNTDVMDVELLWEARPGGFNNYLVRSPTPPFGRQYKPIRYRLPPDPSGAPTPTIPPYEGRPHQQLFVPSNAV